MSCGSRQDDCAHPWAIRDIDPENPRPFVRLERNGQHTLAQHAGTVRIGVWSDNRQLTAGRAVRYG